MSSHDGTLGDQGMGKPLLGRCKDCDYALFVAPEQVAQVREVAELRDIKQSGVPYRVGRTILARCDKGHRVFSLRYIEGTYSPDHKCDARCLNAKGWKCRCSCGGANHGRGYAIAHVVEAHEEREERHLGEVGRHIKGNVRLIRKHVREGGSHPTIYTFTTLDETARLVWFAPYYADPNLNEGESFSIRAKVKRHENDPTYGKTTVVTYVEGPEGKPLTPKEG